MQSHAAGVATWATRPILRLLSSYENYLREKDDTEEHVRTTVRVILRCVVSCKLESEADLDRVDRIRAWLHDTRKSEGTSARTLNYRAGAMRSFAAWLVREGVLLRNPLLGLQRANERGDRRRKRRPLTDDEMVRLLTCVSEARNHHGLSGRERVMLYTTAVLTGLRVRELAHLTRHDLELACDPAILRVRASINKRRREDHLPINGKLAGQLRTWLVGRGFGRLWPGRWWDRSAVMFRRDLEATGIRYLDEQGRVADFHALRHTFLTNLTRAGVHPRIAQALARHSTIVLTMAVYTHVDMKETAKAVESIECPLPMAGRVGGDGFPQ